MGENLVFEASESKTTMCTAFVSCGCVKGDCTGPHCKCRQNDNKKCSSKCNCSRLRCANRKLSANGPEITQDDEEEAAQAEDEDEVDALLASHTPTIEDEELLEGDDDEELWSS
mmetsp:Transcript_22487/g.33898  ORF Transcript_22487/g.33898 Transcript_22487/m.33898 type:complete len:114 (-) Transcript_22487:127-468(-)